MRTVRDVIASAIANARGWRHGVPTVKNVLEMLPEKLTKEVFEDADTILKELNENGFIIVDTEKEKRPQIICLCGSTRFYKEFTQVNLEFTLKGCIVLSIGAAVASDEEHFGHLPKEEFEKIKKDLDTLHLHKIDLADEVFVINKDGYIGESTSKEIEYAIRQNKKVSYLE